MVIPHLFALENVLMILKAILQDRMNIVNGVRIDLTYIVKVKLLLQVSQYVVLINVENYMKQILVQVGLHGIEETQYSHKL